jgi:hypothetical protein
MKKAKKHRGLFLHPDDMEVGQICAVHSMKLHNNPSPIFGEALQITAIQLPFVLAQPLAYALQPPVTLDVRYMNMMPVSNEYADAQKKNRGPEDLTKNEPPPEQEAHAA